MSIIYDALKKVEDKLDLPGEKNIAVHIKQAAKKKPYFSYFMVAVAGFALASVAYNLATKYYLTRVITISSGEYAQAKLGLKVTLNGIFFSEDSNYALINNQIVKEGDTVLGATVRRITSTDVLLDKNGTVVRLSTRK